MSRLKLIGLSLGLTGLLSGCSSNLSRFDILQLGGGKTSNGLQVDRYETVSQGGGVSQSSSFTLKTSNAGTWCENVSTQGTSHTIQSGF